MLTSFTGMSPDGKEKSRSWLLAMIPLGVISLDPNQEFRVLYKKRIQLKEIY